MPYIRLRLTHFLPAKWYHALGFYTFWVNGNAPGALELFQKALSLSDTAESPNRVGLWCLSSISQILIRIGNPLGAQEHAQRAQAYAEHLGDITAQAQSLYLQARCHAIFANYQRAQTLAQTSVDLFKSCGLDGGPVYLQFRNAEAEIHLLKTEYLESRQIQASIASTKQPIAEKAILAKLNIVMIDMAVGVDPEPIRKQLDACRLEIKTLYGRAAADMGSLLDQRYVELALHEGDHTTANVGLATIFAGSRDTYLEEALECVEKLADLSTAMNSLQTTFGWSVLFLVLALKGKEKLATMKAVRCLGQIFAAQGDAETALNLFHVALDGFAFMDIHQWRADCMVRIADILMLRGEVSRAVDLWRAAIPLFERSSQAKDIARLETKLLILDPQNVAHHG